MNVRAIALVVAGIAVAMVAGVLAGPTKRDAGSGGEVVDLAQGGSNCRAGEAQRNPPSTVGESTVNVHRPAGSSPLHPPYVPPTGRNAARDQATDTAQIEQWTRELELAAIRRAREPRRIPDLFGEEEITPSAAPPSPPNVVRAPTPPATPAPSLPAPVIQAPPAPAAPTIPMRFIGRWIEPGMPPRALFTLGDDALQGAEGETVRNQFRIDRIADDAVTITHLPVNRSEVLRLP